MRIAVLSDIHANLHALQAVWEDLTTQRPDAVYCLGDLVGYGAYPNEVVDFIRAQAIPTVMGNYDDGVGFDQDSYGCAHRAMEEGTGAHRSFLWTKQHTTDENKAFLRSLPLQIRLEARKPRILCVHGSPRSLNEYLYEDRPIATFEQIAAVAGCDLLLFGHTHRPYQKSVFGTLFVNAGSVGRPEDGDARAGYVIVEAGWRLRVEFRRVAYDVAAAALAIRQSELPLELTGIRRNQDVPRDDQPASMMVQTL